MIKNKDLKRRIVEISYKLGLSHIGSCLTAVDIIKEIYDIKNPNEKFVLSSGHAHLAHLVVRHEKIYKDHKNSEWIVNKDFVEQSIDRYGIHCDRKAGCDVSTGSLGHGLGIALGMALADRSKNVYCLISDGECSEGSIWEAFHVIDKYKIENIMIYLNDNSWGAYDRTRLNAIPNSVDWRFTNMDDYPLWLQGQAAHYVILDEGKYKELMEVLK